VAEAEPFFAPLAWETSDKKKNAPKLVFEHCISSNLQGGFFYTLDLTISPQHNKILPE